MAPKRPLSPTEKEEGEGSRPAKQWCCFRREFRGNSFTRRFQMQIEPITRGVVREELQKAFSNHLNQGHRQLHDHIESTRYQLQFQNQLNGPFYTHRKIEANDRMLVRIAIIDKNLQNIVTSGPYSSVSVEVVVLQSDIGDDRDNCSSEEFNIHIVPERKGKVSLLKGELVIQLVNGVADLTDVTFTDNSSWTKHKKFRLGLRLSRRGDIRNAVQEGISESFRVKENRVKGNEKHHPPSLTDKVWRLKCISKDGPYCKALKKNGITTVEDFLKAYTKDEAQLRKILCKNSESREIPSKYWNALVKHAKECVLGDELYSYCITEHNVMLFLNSIYQVVGATIGGRYSFFDKLNPSQQASVEKWKKLMHQNMNTIQLDHKMINNHPIPLHMIDSASFIVSSSSQLGTSNPQMHFDQVALQVALDETLPDYGPSHDLSQRKDISDCLDVHPVGHFTSSGGASFDDSFERENIPLSSFPPSLNTDPVYSPEAMTVYQNVSDSQFDWEVLLGFQYPPQSQFNELSEVLPDTQLGSLNSCSFDEFADHSDGVPQISQGETSRPLVPLSPRRWIKIIALLKLVLIRKCSAARRAKFVPPSCQTLVPEVLR